MGGGRVALRTSSANFIHLFIFSVECTMTLKGFLTSVHTESWVQRVCYVVAVKGWYACGRFFFFFRRNGHRVMTVA